MDMPKTGKIGPGTSGKAVGDAVRARVLALYPVLVREGHGVPRSKQIIAERLGLSVARINSIIKESAVS